MPYSKLEIGEKVVVKKTGEVGHVDHLCFDYGVDSKIRYALRVGYHQYRREELRRVDVSKVK